MADNEEMEEDLFADLYDGDDTTTAHPAVAPVPAISAQETNTPGQVDLGYGEEPETAMAPGSFDNEMVGDSMQDYSNGSAREQSMGAEPSHPSQEPFSLKEDGKMFIGGLNWETTDESLHNYFSEFGEVQECTVMRDGATGRSRGFGFLTFKDPKTVNTVMVKEHFLDGKIIDPKRAIPRDEQEKTSKIFVGGVSQDATETDFTNFFAQFGRVVDATLMMDKDTGRPRGFGFVTFDSEAAVEKVLDYHPLEILGKPIEVKKAQPRGKIAEEEEFRGGRGRGKFGGREERFNNDSNQNQPNQNPAMMGQGGMTPQMMAQYWQRMQQYFAMMQQQMATNAMSGMGGMGMNPQMMQQMQMQQMQQMQNMQGGKSPNGGNMQGMTPQMMNMMGMQNGMNMGGQRAPMGPGGQGGQNRPGFSAQEQLAFEQQKYEQQQARRSGGHQGSRGGSVNLNQNQGGPQSWEGMYDDVPQPEGNNARGPVRNLTPSGSRPPKGPTPQPNNAPANAPTGPKNAGKPGANFRGGRGGARYHPYGR